MKKEQLLVKRFLTLVGKTPVPNFKDELNRKIYLFNFELPKIVPVNYVKEILEDFEYFLEKEEQIEFQNLSKIDKYLYILDNVQEARDYCKKYFKKEEP